MDLISITIITYNRLDYTKECIKSVKKNTTKPFEIHVVDNNSTDGTREYLKRLKGINVHLLDDNYYPGYATNYGWDRADKEAKYLARLDNDILVEKGWNEHVYDVFNAFPKLGQFGVLDQRQRLHVNDRTTQMRVKKSGDVEVNTWWPSIGGPCVVKKELFDNGHRWDERSWKTLGQNTEDVHFSHNIRRKGHEIANTIKRIAVHMAEGNYDDEYYEKTFAERQLSERLKSLRDEGNKYENYQKVR